jgi:hypothetical protein
VSTQVLTERDLALALLRESTAQARAAQDAVLRHVQYSRIAGATWAAIGDALGVSRQAAQERYQHLLDSGDTQTPGTPHRR